MLSLLQLTLEIIAILATVVWMIAVIELLKEAKRMLEKLTQDVARETEVIGSAVVFIKGLRQQIIDAGTNPNALKALTDQMEANADSLAAAIAVNTPADHTPQSGDSPVAEQIS